MVRYFIIFLSRLVTKVGTRDSVIAPRPAQSKLLFSLGFSMRLCELGTHGAHIRNKPRNNKLGRR